jgi:hypothetical protein
VITDIQAQHYLFEIIREADLGERLFRRFQTAAETWLQVEHSEEPDGRTLWTGTEAEHEMEEAIEGILSSFARISLFLFPEKSTGEFGKERGRRLRELTGVTENHPIGNRDLRNHWMHLDDRFDTFVRKHGAAPVGYYLDSAHRVSDPGRAEMLRLVDPGAEKVFVLGRAFELSALANAVEHVGQQATLAIAPRGIDA